MRKAVNLFIVIVLFAGISFAQDSTETAEFTMEYQVETTPVKSQGRTGTCWVFASTSFWETELIRINKGIFDVSEMYTVRKTYPIKANNYIRYHGNANWGEGGQAHDFLHIVKDYGMVPEEIYNGGMDNPKTYNHREMGNVLKGILDGVLKTRGDITNNWKSLIETTLNAYMGTPPEKFEYNGKIYTPKSYFEESGLNPDDYVEITSYTHHPFYSQFILEIPDNWTHDLYYNIPFDELMEVINNALKNGYSVAWDGDSGGDNFDRQTGIAAIQKEGEELIFPVVEKEVTLDDRQKAFDSFATTDDHLMHLTGIAKDQNGKTYYYTKNSWGTVNKVYDGYWYMTEQYLKLKTIAIMVHKDAIPLEIKEKMGL